MIIAVTIVTCSNINGQNIYVSLNGSDNNSGTIKQPVATVNKALELVNGIRKSDKETVTINILEEEYHLPAPILITPKHNNIVIKGEGANNTILKGSKKIETNWKSYNEHIWVTDIAVDFDFSQLIINGKKQVLARYPNFDPNGRYWNGHASDAISEERVGSWTNPKGGFVHAMHAGKWGGFHYEIIGVDENNELLLKGGHQNNRPSKMHSELRMVENVFELLDHENEWYFDKEKRKLYFWPSETMNLNNTVVEVSQLKHLVEFKGTSNNAVRNVEISNLNFQFSQRTIMEEYEPLLRSDWTIYRGGAILMEGTESCVISNSEFSNLGGNVIFVNAYNRNVTITGNHIHNVGASAISFVGESSSVRSPSFQYMEFVDIEDRDTIPGPANNQYPSDCLVENNLIYNIGTIEKQVAGVQISMAMNIHVKNNSIYKVPRAGINVSEGTFGGHIIEYNDVFKTVLETHDHGAFNSWGRDRFWYPKNWKIMDALVTENPDMPYWDAVHTTVIRNNRFRSDHGWDIDLDDGSSNYHIYNNLCLQGGIKLREGFYRTVENNIMINNSFHPHVWFTNSDDVFKNNIMMTKYFDIKLRGWGKEVDYNLFPDELALNLAQKNNTDEHSLYGKPLFENPVEGNFKVKADSPALKLGFVNFPMDKFGVQKPELKAIAEQPEIPELIFEQTQLVKIKKVKWLGGVIKNIETKEEQSAYGVNNKEGVIIVKASQKSKLSQHGVLAGDVIVTINHNTVKDITTLLRAYNKLPDNSNAEFLIIRNQQELKITVKK